jgi:hypothetical protein
VGISELGFTLRLHRLWCSGPGSFQHSHYVMSDNTFKLSVFSILIYLGVLFTCGVYDNMLYNRKTGEQLKQIALLEAEVYSRTVKQKEAWVEPTDDTPVTKEYELQDCMRGDIFDEIVALSYYTAEELEIIKAECGENIPTNFDWLITYVLAIGMAENGSEGKEFGILNPKADTYEKQAGWCAATVYKNYVRWINAGQPGAFVEYLGARYCPVGAENDPTGLNKNWVPNVMQLREKVLPPSVDVL